MAILAFFVGHWTLSVFMQTFFLHRYGAHKMFTMSKGWERFFYLLTFILQGSSYLEPRGYAILHRMHHAYSDTPADPHSPRNHRGPLGLYFMMKATKGVFFTVAHEHECPEPRFDGDIPQWKWLDRIGQTWPVRIAWGTAYVGFYLVFATAWWQFLLLPIHFMMGPVHGAIVNWCGHKYGYRNFASTDDSRNTLVLDFLTLGELFQNNHHRFSRSPNFACKWFEIDPAWQVIRVFAALGIIQLATKPQRATAVAIPGESPART